jgi:NAD(P)-dependent dehydrogenase (short-subunit alcohol dehydrogenase family)
MPEPERLTGRSVGNTRTVKRDPRSDEPSPPFPEQPEMEPPGSEAKMRPAPDFGEDSYVGHDRLRDRAAIVTGADSGIGRAVALAFAREGADILISYLDEDEDAAETKRVVEASGRRASLVPGDIGDEDHCRTIVERAMDGFGRLDVLVNNAAWQIEPKPLEEIEPGEIERTFRTNVLSFFWLCRAALPHLKPGAAIINTTSIQAYQPSPELLPYASTKGAIVTFTKALAQQLVERGIRVNAVAPGPVWTPLVVASFGGSSSSEFGAENPMGRPAQPAELASAFVFLASEESRFVNGEILAVTGGKPIT